MPHEITEDETGERQRHEQGSRDGVELPALGGDLTTLRTAIDLYATEHTGTYPAADKIGAQLTQYSNAAGAVSLSVRISIVMRFV